MKKIKMKKIIGLLVFVVIVVITVITLINNKKTATDKIFEFDKSKPINVITDQVEIEPLSRDFNYSGTFQPNKEVKLSADTQGKITKLFVENGDVVKKGQSLLELDKSMIKLQLDAINTKIRGIEKDIERYKILVESNAIQGVKLEKALLGLDAAKIERATIQEQLNKSTVKSPFEGVITAKLTEIGAFAAPGVPLFQLTDISTVKFTILVTEYEVNKFHQKDSVQISVDAINDEKFKGIVTMVGSKANKSMNFPVEICVENKSMQIKAGMFGHIQTSVSLQSNQGVLIPLSAIIGETVAPKVYVVESGTVILRDVQLGGTIKDKAIVKNGVTPGETIVVEGVTNLFEGANVITK